MIGSAIGNKLSDANGGGAAGAVAGALLGAEAFKENAQKGEIVGYRRQEVCEVQRVVLEETIERIDGYKIEVELIIVLLACAQSALMKKANVLKFQSKSLTA